MLGMKLVRLIEAHSEALSEAVTEQILRSERTSDYLQISREDLHRRVSEVYQHLGEWLLQKPEAEISSRFQAIAARRAAEHIRLPQFLWAMMLTRDHLWRFLRYQSYADSIFELHGELEVLQLVNQFFDRAMYYAVVGYEVAGQGVTPMDDWARARAAAISIGLLSDSSRTP